LLTPEAANRSRAGTRVGLTPDTPSMPPRQALLKGRLIRTEVESPDKCPTFLKSPVPQVDEVSGPKDWNRWLVFLQVSLLLCSWSRSYGRIWTMIIPSDCTFGWCWDRWYFACLASHPPVINTIKPRAQISPLLCFLGFAVAIGWISTIANEVVGVLKAFE